MPDKEISISEAPERMRIGELARRADISHRTIHYYEEEGLLAPTERATGGHRYYNQEALARLHKIKQLQQLGLSLEEIRGVIDLYFDEPSGVMGKQQVLKILREQLAETEHKLAELERFRDDLQTNISRIEGMLEQAIRKARERPATPLTRA
jgi:MerR family transcriptional regulator, copper efflux regulator